MKPFAILLLTFLVACPNTQVIEPPIDEPIIHVTTPPARTFSMGFAHSLVIKSDHTLWSLGSNYEGERGVGNTEVQITPTQVMSDVISAGAGRYYSAALKSDSSVWTWGYKDYLADGSKDSRATPKQVMTGVKKLFVGPESTLVIKNDDSLWRWGNWIEGNTFVRNHLPEKVMDDVLTASAGYFHWLAVKNDGTLWAWGKNVKGSVGNGTTALQNTPVQIMSSVVAASAGGELSLALQKDGSLWAWGANEYGQACDKVANENVLTPTKVLTSVKRFDAGSDNSLMVKIDGSLWACGAYNHEVGEISSRPKILVIKPTLIAQDAVDVTSLEYTSLVLKKDGSLLQWGQTTFDLTSSSWSFITADKPITILNNVLVR